MTRSSLTFLLDTDDLAAIKRCAPEVLRGHVVAMEVEVYLALRNRGIHTITPWDVLNHDSRGELIAWHDRIWQYWARNAHIEYRGIDLPVMARFRHEACFARMAWVSFVVDRGLAHYEPDEVVTFEERVGHGLEQPAHYRKMPVFFAVVRGMAEQAGIPVRLLQRPAHDDSTFVDYAAQAAAPQLPAIDPGKVFGEMPYVLFTGSGIDLRRQLPLIAALRKRGSCGVVQLYKAADAKTLAAMHAIGHHVWHESQLDAFAVGGTQPSTEAAKLRLLDQGRAPDSAIGAIFDNPYLSIHFDFIFGEYARKMAGHVDRWKGFLRHHPPVLIVANYPEPIVEVACQIKVPALILPHGIMSTFDERWYRSFPDVFIGASGDNQLRFLQRVRPDHQQVVLTGDPGFDLSRESPNQSRDRLRFTWRSHVRGKGADPEPPTLGPYVAPTYDQRNVRMCILLATGPLGRPAHAAELPTIDWKRGIETVDELAKLMHRQATWHWLIKPHPRYDHAALYERYIFDPALRSRVQLVTETPLAQCLPAVDVVVFANTRSSGIVEASFGGRPVIILNTAMTWLDLESWGMHRWPVAESVHALEAMLERSAGPIARRDAAPTSDAGAHRYYNELAQQSEQAATAFFGRRPHSAIDACADFIVEQLSVRTATVTGAS